MEGSALPSLVTMTLAEWRQTHCGSENGPHGVAKSRARDYKPWLGRKQLSWFPNLDLSDSWPLYPKFPLVGLIP